MKFEHGFLLDHDPGDPRVGDGEQEEEPHDGTGGEVEELDAEGEGQEDAGGEDVDGPFESHGSSLFLTEFNGFEVLQIRSRFLDIILSG